MKTRTIVSASVVAAVGTVASVVIYRRRRDISARTDKLLLDTAARLAESASLAEIQGYYYKSAALFEAAADLVPDGHADIQQVYMDEAIRMRKMAEEALT